MRGAHHTRTAFLLFHRNTKALLKSNRGSGNGSFLFRRWNANSSCTKKQTKATKEGDATIVKKKQEIPTEKSKADANANKVHEIRASRGDDDAKRPSVFQYGVVTMFMMGIATSLYSRHWRKCHLGQISLASDGDVFFLPHDDDVPVVVEDTNKVRRNLQELDSMVSRTGLMGKSIPGSKSVKEELNIIRQWHLDRGFEGGVVLRELTKPLFGAVNGNENGNGNVTNRKRGNENGNGDGMVMEGGDDVEQMPPAQLPQRECYYLYYEIKDNGHALQQIFCRGTTLFADVQTCLKSYLVYDEELGIHLHKGFRDHALRLVNDVEPLLGHPNNPRATVEVSGHSLGGAVAMIVAMLLKKRGYNVQKVLSIAGARFGSKSEAERVMVDELLPLDTLRIEDDLDCVPFLPPWATSAGDKLWLLNDHDGHRSSSTPTSTSSDFLLPSSARYIPRSVYLEKDHLYSWTDVVFTNLRLPETVVNEKITHTIASHRAKISHLMEELKSSQQWLQEQSEANTNIHTTDAAKIEDR